MPLETVTAPEGAEFIYDEVSTAHGQKSLGEVPLLTWKSVEAARSFYGDEAIQRFLNASGVRIPCQAIARRGKIAGKSDDDIAKAQLEFRPGEHTGGASTPASRAAKAAKKVQEKVGDSSAVADFLSKLEGMSAEAIAAKLASL